VQGKPALRRRDVAKEVQQLQLKRGDLRLRDRLTALLASGTFYHGGRDGQADKFIAPTFLVNVSPDLRVMQKEIFGPILPVLEVDNV
jgi:acyl-CoA reductase-like NAD-dependent aldehyde dehydrogenase